MTDKDKNPCEDAIKKCDALLEAAIFGGGHMLGPDALEYVAGILERDTKALGWAIILREKAKRERVAIAKVKPTP